jgi:3-(3-hydroxy-phenyl)propionate hydroxylase
LWLRRRELAGAELIGSSVEALAAPAQWLVVDVLLTEPVSTLAPGTVQICDPARPITSIECVGGRHRWEIKLMPGDDPATFSEPENVWQRLTLGLRRSRRVLSAVVLHSER